MITYGFFNSVNGDRKYDANQMTEFYNGIVTEGVFQHIANGLEVTGAVASDNTLMANIDSGRAIIQNRWLNNTASYMVNLEAPDQVYGRIDAIVVRLDMDNRVITFEAKTGTPSSSPVAPSLTRTGSVYEICLAYATVAANTTSAPVITDKRSDTSVCGWASVAQATSGEVDQMLEDLETGYDGTEYSTPAAQVQGSDQKLQNQIDAINSEIDITNQVLSLRNFTKQYDITENKFIRTQDGGVRDNNSFDAILTPIPVEDTDKITTKNVYVYFYTSSAFLSAYTSDQTEVSIPQGTEYILLCWGKTSENLVAYVTKADGSIPCFFDGSDAVFADETIPASAISGMEIIEDSTTSMTSLYNAISGKLSDGYYLRMQYGDMREASGFKSTLDFIDISGATKIFVPKNEYACFYAEDTSYISATWGPYTYDKWSDVPANTKYMRVTCQGTTDELIYLKNENGDYILIFDPKNNLKFKSKCIPFNAVNAEGVPATLPPAIKIIAPTGGDYTNIVDANAHCDGSYAMWILPGEYEGEFQAADNTYGNKGTRKVYVGLSKDDCKAVRYGSAYADDVFHTNGKTYMKNLSLFAKKSVGASSCGYAIHLDNGWLSGGKAVFEDCYFFSEGRAAAGIGTRPDCDIVFRNCIFESTYDGNGAVFFHNDPNITEGGNQKLTFENCIFHSQSGVALHIQELGGDGNDIALTMINCTLYSDTLGVSTSIVTVDKTGYTGSLDGNVNLTARSHGNNIDMGAIL